MSSKKFKKNRDFRICGDLKFWSHDRRLWSLYTLLHRGRTLHFPTPNTMAPEEELQLKLTEKEKEHQLKIEKADYAARKWKREAWEACELLEEAYESHERTKEELRVTKEKLRVTEARRRKLEDLAMFRRRKIGNSPLRPKKNLKNTTALGSESQEVAAVASALQSMKEKIAEPAEEKKKSEKRRLRTTKVGPGLTAFEGTVFLPKLTEIANQKSDVPVTLIVPVVFTNALQSVLVGRKRNLQKSNGGTRCELNYEDLKTGTTVNQKEGCRDKSYPLLQLFALNSAMEYINTLAAQNNVAPLSFTAPEKIEKPEDIEEAFANYLRKDGNNEIRKRFSKPGNLQQVFKFGKEWCNKMINKVDVTEFGRVWNGKTCDSVHFLRDAFTEHFNSFMINFLEKNLSTDKLPAPWLDDNEATQKEARTYTNRSGVKVDIPIEWILDPNKGNDSRRAQIFVTDILDDAVHSFTSGSYTDGYWNYLKTGGNGLNFRLCEDLVVLPPEGEDSMPCLTEDQKKFQKRINLCLIYNAPVCKTDRKQGTHERQHLTYTGSDEICLWGGIHVDYDYENFLNALQQRKTLGGVEKNEAKSRRYSAFIVLRQRNMRIFELFGQRGRSSSNEPSSTKKGKGGENKNKVGGFGEEIVIPSGTFVLMEKWCPHQAVNCASYIGGERHPSLVLHAYCAHKDDIKHKIEKKKWRKDSIVPLDKTNSQISPHWPPSEIWPPDDSIKNAWMDFA
jgi:hypothetical protein